MSEREGEIERESERNKEIKLYVLCCRLYKKGKKERIFIFVYIYIKIF